MANSASRDSRAYGRELGGSCRPGETPAVLEVLEPRVLLSADMVFPADAGVINVTTWNANPALNAVPNDGQDDTAAIQAAIESALSPHISCWVRESRFGGWVGFD